jgi:glucosylceramidase
MLAEVFDEIIKAETARILQAYYSITNGIGYTLARTTTIVVIFRQLVIMYIAEGDDELKNFNIDHDRQYRIPLIKQATEVAGKLTMYLPWSLLLMKTNGTMLQGGKLNGSFISLG